MTNSLNDCVFCRIIEGSLPARKLYEDESVVAFWDARPAAPIHFLIIPRRHLATLNDVPNEDPLMSHITAVAKKLTADLGVAGSGYRFFVNVNKEGGQVIYHLHAHVVAGNDFGTGLIKAAIACAAFWRKLVGRSNKNSEPH